MDASRVAPKLYVGSHPGDGQGMRDRARAAGFSAVVRVAAELPHEFPLHDAPLTAAQLSLAIRASAEVAQRLARGERVLVTCQAGRNRSALVAALAMVQRFRISGAEALRVVRERRVTENGPVLSNASFAALLRRLPAV